VVCEVLKVVVAGTEVVALCIARHRDVMVSMLRDESSCQRRKRFCHPGCIGARRRSPRAYLWIVDYSNRMLRQLEGEASCWAAVVSMVPGDS
jgi:hypothetical protein